MILYYTPGACSLAPHIILRETGLDFSLKRVDLGKHQLEDGTDYYTISPRGQVPLLELDDGQRLTEGPVITHYLADRAGREDLLRPGDELSRYRVLEWLNYITSELHKGFSPLFGGDYPQEAKVIVRKGLRRKYEWVARQLEGRDYVTGSIFTVADAYLFTVTNWARHADVDITDLDSIAIFQQRVAGRPAVIEVMAKAGYRWPGRPDSLD